MYQPLYFLIFYAINILAFIIILILLYIFVFSNNESKPSPSKTTLDFLLEQVKNSNNNKEILDSVMREFYSHFYNIYKTSPMINTWLSLIQNITMLDYMSVEQVAKFRDDLMSKNNSIKNEIKIAIGESLKYRENTKKKK
ncbi:hypothetical protein [Helicobacter sp. MIT 14-3879]|uniref:hypothetical protein n=1 Tax=Helicobacter sp. MIT 14-3879 TaxID=2040649 RepID=UPI000E1ED518|nr:hypothetical protein [Helicobacter sp. MIT 14-3879]RDU65511.1 hypothetical protein CQA44_00515 [Helicobacter sp. MIT 14-3879]